MARSLRGQCLVSAKHLRDQNFYKTAVLMIEHNSEGAMGLVINRPSSILVSHALPKQFELGDNADLVYVGGPVEPPALMILHNADDLAENERAIVPGVYIGSSELAFEEVLRRSVIQSPGLRCRIFSGYAGWGAGQLESELDRGDWYVTPAKQELVYHDDPYAVYDIILQQICGTLPLMPNDRTNPQWN